MNKEFYGDKRFYKFLDIMAEVHSQKNHDYAGVEDPLRNFKICESMGIPAWKGVLVRISDKFSRVSSFAKKEEYKVKDENVIDTLLDMANYAVICAILFQDREKVSDDKT
jgi:hypothetical protein